MNIRRSGLHVITRASLPHCAVQESGAPAEVWTEIISPPNSPNLYYDVTWAGKTATRLPEVSRAPATSPDAYAVVMLSYRVVRAWMFDGVLVFEASDR